MPFVCDTCGKCYVQKRNLTRHIAEKHVITKFWKCSRDCCSSKFVRRSYLVSHLEKFHKLSKVTARELAIRSSQCITGATSASSLSRRPGVEAISDDDSIFDIIAELDQIQAETENVNCADALLDSADVPLDLNNNIDIDVLPEISDIDIGEADVADDRYSPVVTDISDDDKESADVKAKIVNRESESVVIVKSADKNENVGGDENGVNKVNVVLENHADVRDESSVKSDDGINEASDAENNVAKSEVNKNGNDGNEFSENGEQSEMLVDSVVSEVIGDKSSESEYGSTNEMEDVSSDYQADYESEQDVGDGSEADSSFIVISDDDDSRSDEGDSEEASNHDDDELALVPYNLISVTDVFHITFFRTTYFRDGTPVWTEQYSEQYNYRL